MIFVCTCVVRVTATLLVDAEETVRNGLIDYDHTKRLELTIALVRMENRRSRTG
ncbi:hypothetical protein BJX99DRAFT_138082 [Aspergillus californicus]